MNRNRLPESDTSSGSARPVTSRTSPSSHSTVSSASAAGVPVGERRTLRATPGDPGTFQGTFTMADPGAFSFLVFANQNPADAVQAREDVLVRIPDRELAQSSQDAETLQRIAEASSGQDGRARYVFLADAEELAKDFAGRRPYENREETRTRPAWDDLVGSNLKGPLFLSQALADELRRRRGAIVNIVDIHAERPLRHYPLYSAAKAGLAGLTRALALELAPEVRVNGIAPGPIEWPEDDQFPPAERAAIIRHTLLQREGSPGDIACTVRFLLFEAPYVTGQILAVDGGRSAHL